MTYSELKKYLSYVDDKISPVMKELLNSDVDKKNKHAVHYQILTGGKRVRPALAIASCKMFGGRLNDILYPAASLEILHNYTLIIDDIIDNSILRRKNPTCWYKFGRSISEVITIDYAAAIFQKAGQWKKSAEVSEILAKTMKAIVDGEILDILFEQSGRENEPFINKNRYREISEKDYFKMVRRKTSLFIEASCEIGGLVAGAKKREIGLLKKYGLAFGTAFQIQNDILDIIGTEKVFGKKIGEDIIEGKLGNIVILLAFKELSLNDRRKFLNIMRKGEVTKTDVREAIRLIQKTNSLSKASTLGKSYIYEAKRNLNLLPKNNWNDTLMVMADYVIERQK